MNFEYCSKVNECPKAKWYKAWVEPKVYAPKAHWVVFRVCWKCVRKGRPMAVPETYPVLKKLELFDEDDYNGCLEMQKFEREEQRREYYAKRQQEWEERQAKYRDYIDNSPVWFDKRRRVLERAGGLCEACRRRAATQVHHRTYDRLFNEPLSDLEAICVPCHQARHNKYNPDSSDHTY